MTRDTVGGYRGSGDGATMRPPPPLPSASMGRVDPPATLTPTEALAQAARASRAAITHMNEGLKAEPGGYRYGLLDQAARLAQIAEGLCAYATAAGRWQDR